MPEAISGDDDKGSDLQVKRVVVCADDFGLDPAVDAAVLSLATQGRVSATSCLVDGPSFEANASRLRASGLACGLHLNFTERMGQSGLALPLGRLMRACWTRRLDRLAVSREIARQLDRYEQVMGEAPDYVDGHQHVHQFPQIRDALIAELCRRYPSHASRPWLRCTRAGSQPGVALGDRVKASVISLLGARELGRLARHHDFHANRAFLGVYDFQGGATAYASLLRQWLAAAHDGDLIMCHPATGAVPGDALGTQRQSEYEVWGNGETGEWLRQYAVVPVAFGAPRHAGATTAP